MKRYLLFYGDAYYPCGGWDDFKGDFDTVEEAKKEYETPSWKPDWYQIVDTHTKKEIP